MADASDLGSPALSAAVMFLTTLSFLITTPDVWQPGYGFPFLGAGAAFLIKDAVLLAAAARTAVESFARGASSR